MSFISGVFHRSEFWHPRRKPAVIFSKQLFFQNSWGVCETHIYSVKIKVKNKIVFYHEWMFFLDPWSEWTELWTWDSLCSCFRNSQRSLPLKCHGKIKLTSFPRDAPDPRGYPKVIYLWVLTTDRLWPD